MQRKRKQLRLTAKEEALEIEQLERVLKEHAPGARGGERAARVLHGSRAASAGVVILLRRVPAAQMFASKTSRYVSRPQPRGRTRWRWSTRLPGPLWA